MTRNDQRESYVWGYQILVKKLSGRFVAQMKPPGLSFTTRRERGGGVGWSLASKKRGGGKENCSVTPML